MKCQVVFTFFVLMEVSHCSGGGVRRVREAYNSRAGQETERDQYFANDFSLMRDPPRPDGNPSHYHGPYHDHHHHYHQFTSKPTNQEEDFKSVNYSSQIPLDFAKTLNEAIASDLLLNYIEDSPQTNENSFIVSRFGADNSNETERNAALPARPAKCIPELTPVRIAKSNDPNVFYVPECTRIERCGGCCSHTLLSCQPVETETVTMTVTKTEYTGTRKLKYVGKEPVAIEKHTKCKCGCKIKAEDCNSYQEYRESECRCVCKNIDEEKKCYKNSYKKLWNESLCACQCREVEPCSTGFMFDFNECRCIQSQFKRRYILTEFTKEQPETSPEENTDKK